MALIGRANHARVGKYPKYFKDVGENELKMRKCRRNIVDTGQFIIDSLIAASIVNYKGIDIVYIRDWRSAPLL